MFDVAPFIGFVRELYGRPDGPIPLHAPIMGEREKALVAEAIDSTYVSSVGAFVTAFEASVAAFVGARHAVATVNGTAALPLVRELIGQGMAPGAGMAFLIAGGVTSIPAAIAVHAVARRPVFIAYLGFALLGALLSGLAWQQAARFM